MNTTKAGKITFLVFKKKSEKIYTGVCLEFGIVLQDKDENVLKCELKKAAFGYLHAVIKGKMSEKLLNNQADKKYFELYKHFLSEETNRLKKKPATSGMIKGLSDLNVNAISVNQLANLSCYA